MASIGGRGLKFKVEVDPKSTKKVIKNLQRYDRKKRRQIGQLIDKTSNNILRDARTRILVDTGLAKASTGRRLNKKNGYVVGASIFTSVHYAVFIERMKPYLIPAYNRNVRNFVQQVKQILNRN